MDGKAETTHSHADATNSTSGFMSASDKAKLDGLENVDMTGYVKVLRNASGAVQDDEGWVGTMMITEDPLSATNFVQIRTDGDKPTFAMNTMEVNGFTDTITPDADGYMLATDKAVKSYVDANKTTVTVDSSLSDSSTNPVQNKVIKAAIDGKADVAHNHNGVYANASHTHDAADVTTGTFDAARIPTITDAKIQGMSASKLTGTIPTENLPSYVDDVVEYDKQTSFPPTGEAGKIYVDTTTNKTYRWSGSNYVEISASLALGTTSSTAFRGDYGNAAYQHAVTNKGSEFASGLYKITTNAEGHVTAATAVVKDDITALGIPAQDTTYVDATTDASGLMSATDKTKLDGIAEGADKLPEGGTDGQVLTKTSDGEEWTDIEIPEVPDNILSIDVLQRNILQVGSENVKLLTLENDVSHTFAYLDANEEQAEMSVYTNAYDGVNASILSGNGNGYLKVESLKDPNNYIKIGFGGNVPYLTMANENNGISAKTVNSISDSINLIGYNQYALVTEKAVVDYVAAKVTFASDEDFKAYMGIS